MRLITVTFATLSLLSCSTKNEDQLLSTFVNAPSDLKIERLGTSTVTLSWSDNSNNEIGFRLFQRKTDQSNNSEIATVDANTTSYTIEEGLIEGENYYFGVQAIGEKTNSKTEYILYHLISSNEFPQFEFVDNIQSNNVCIYATYKISHLSNHSNIRYGLCWSASGIPTINDSKSEGADASGIANNILQVIPNVNLDYDTSYIVRGYISTNKGVYYSDTQTAKLKTEPQAIILEWTKIIDRGLPIEVELYKTTSKLNGRNFNAWYAIADPTKVDLKLHLPSNNQTLETQSASFGDNCYVMINGGFFGIKEYGVTVVNSVRGGDISYVRGSLKPAEAEYNENYFVTRGMFGIDANNQCKVVWVGGDEKGENIKYYETPLPTLKGEAKYSPVNEKLPATPIIWNPKYALSAGPVLLKNGKIPFNFNNSHKGVDYYLTNYELLPYDIFGTDVSPDRTAIGYRKDGKVILFVCDGRISESAGAKLTELSQILKGLGCFEAINLDGGGSTAMVVQGIRQNYGLNENRAVASSFGFFKK